MKIRLSLIVILTCTFLKAQKTNVLVWDAKVPSEKSLYIEVNCSTINEEQRIVLEDTENMCWKKTKKLRIKSNELLAVKILNANPYKYNYSIDGNLIDFFNNSQEKFLAQFDKIQGIIENKTNSSTTKPPTDSVGPANTNEEEKEVNKLLSNLHERTNNNSDKNLPLNETDDNSSTDLEIELSKKITIQNALIKEQEIIIRKLRTNEKKLLDTIEKRNKELKDLVSERDSLIKELEKKKKFSEIKRKLNEKIIAIQKLNTELDTFLIKIKNEDFLSPKNFDADRKKYKKSADSISSELRTILIEYEGELSKESAEKVNTIIKESYNPLLKIVNDEITVLFGMQLENYLEPIEIDGENIDVIQVEITRTPRVGAALKTEKFDYKVWIYGGFKFDVSAGIFFSSLENREFTFASNPIPESVDTAQPDMPDDSQDQTTTDAEGKAILPKNLGGWEYGFGTLLNLSYRTGTWVKPTFSFGAMLTDDTKFQFLIGGGGIFGKKERIILHGGLALGRVTRLQSGIIADGETLYAFETEGSIPTEEEFHSSFFFGITYNLGKVKSVTN